MVSITYITNHANTIPTQQRHMPLPLSDGEILRGRKALFAAAAARWAAVALGALASVRLVAIKHQNLVVAVRLARQHKELQHKRNQNVDHNNRHAARHTDRRAGNRVATNRWGEKETGTSHQTLPMREWHIQTHKPYLKLKLQK